MNLLFLNAKLNMRQTTVNSIPAEARRRKITVTDTCSVTTSSIGIPSYGTPTVKYTIRKPCIISVVSTTPSYIHTWPDCSTSKIVLISEVFAFFHHCCNQSEVELWITYIILSKWNYCADSINIFNVSKFKSIFTLYVHECITLNATIPASLHSPVLGLCWSTWSLCCLLSSNVILPWGINVS